MSAVVIGNESNEKQLVRTIETPLGRINVFRSKRVYTEQEIERQKTEFYMLIASLLLSDTKQV